MLADCNSLVLNMCLGKWLVKWLNFLRSPFIDGAGGTGSPETHLLKSLEPVSQASSSGLLVVVVEKPSESSKQEMSWGTGGKAHPYAMPSQMQITCYHSLGLCCFFGFHAAWVVLNLSSKKVTLPNSTYICCCSVSKHNESHLSLQIFNKAVSCFVPCSSYGGVPFMYFFWLIVILLCECSLWETMTLC